MNEATCPPCVGPSPIQRVIADRPYRLWILQENGQGLYADLHNLALLDPAYAAEGWPGWKTVQVCAQGRHLAWAHGATLDLKTLRAEARVSPLFGTIRVLAPATRADFYRPLMYCAPAAPTEPVTAEAIMNAYGIDRDTLSALTGEYAAPADLLYCRLMDLSLALANALAMTPEGIRDLMHWRWRGWSQTTPNPELRSTPFLDIRQGELSYVEGTLYPYPTGRAQA